MCNKEKFVRNINLKIQAGVRVAEGGWAGGGEVKKKIQAGGARDLAQ